MRENVDARARFRRGWKQALFWWSFVYLPWGLTYGLPLPAKGLPMAIAAPVWLALYLGPPTVVALLTTCIAAAWQRCWQAWRRRAHSKP